jgi:hypothetical protein
MGTALFSEDHRFHRDALPFHSAESALNMHAMYSLKAVNPIKPGSYIDPFNAGQR